MWLYRRWVTRVWVAFVAMFYGACIIGISSSVVFPVISADVVQRAMSGFGVSALAWAGAWWVHASIRETKDKALFLITPLTQRRFLIHSLWLQWPFYVIVFFVLPILFIVAAAGLKFWRDTPFTTTPFAITSTVLVYYAILLGPAAESFARRRPPTQWLFMSRHLIGRFLGRVIFIVLALALINWLSKGFVYRSLYGAFEGALRWGDVAFAALAALSPVSAVAIQEDHASPMAALLFTAALALTVLWELTAIVRGFSTLREDPAPPESESDKMLDNEDYSPDEWDEKQSHEWSELLEALDSGGEPVKSGLAAWAYDSRRSPEQTVLLMSEERVVNPVPVEGSGIRHVLTAAAGWSPWLTVVLVFWIAWLSAREVSAKAVWVGVAAAVFAILHNLLVPIVWLDAHRVGLGLPVRLSRTVMYFVRRNWWKNTLADAAVSVLIVVTLDESLATIPLVFAALQLLIPAGNLRGWLELVGETGKKWPSAVWHVATIFMFFVEAMIFIVAWSESGPRRMEDIRVWVALPCITFASTVLAMGLLWRVHRRCDSSLLVHRTSYNAPLDDD